MMSLIERQCYIRPRTPKTKTYANQSFCYKANQTNKLFIGEKETLLIFSSLIAQEKGNGITSQMASEQFFFYFLLEILKLITVISLDL